MRTDILTQALADHERQRRPTRESETSIGGTTVEIADSKTTQTLDDTFLVGANTHGVPRGKEALEAAEIGETQPMQVIKNVIIDQLLGGELAFPSDDDDEDQAEADLKTLVGDIIDGPHLQGDDFDDLVAAWVSDMVDVGTAYAEPLAAAGESDLPFVALKPVDPLSVRHNVSEHGQFEEPAFYQTPFRTLGGSVVALGDTTPQQLTRDELLVFRYPGSNRSGRIYPLSPAMQVKEWLELLADSTTHHSRFYKDNELPPGLLTARDANQASLETIREELEAAKGDPRAAPIVGTDARWVEVGGSAVDLDVIEEQQWFLQLCAAAFGIPKTELGLIEDVNRNTSEAQLSVIHKRVTQPLAKTVGETLTRQALPQFELYDRLDSPFDITLRFSDPRQERAQESHLRERYAAGGLTYREYRKGVGDDMSDVDTTVTINGETVDYGEYPKHVVDALLRDARGDPEPPAQDAPE